MRRSARSKIFPYTTLFRSGNWGDDVDLTPVTGWVRILRREIHSYHWDDIMRQAAAKINSPLLYDLLSEESHLDRKSTRLLQSHSDLVCRLLLEKKKSPTRN